MSDRSDLERRVGDWLQAEAPPRAPATVLTYALGQVAVIPQERPVPWRRLGESVGRSRAIRLALIAALLVAAMLAALVFVGGQNPRPVLGRLAYSLDGDIFFANWDGTDPVRIADGSGTDGYRFPRWSPDGRYLMYERWSQDGDDATLFVTDPTGSVLTSFPGFWASWSPDSNKIATCCYDVHSIDGELLTHVEEPRGWGVSGDQFAGWTARGDALILSLFDEISSVLVFWALPVGADAPRWLAEGFNDGNRIASPDGTRLGIVRSDCIDILDASGMRLKRFTGVGADSLLPNDSYAWGSGDYWAPDSRRIAYSDKGSLNVIDIVTGAVTTLVTTTDTIAHLRWSPDGASLLYVSPVDESSPFAPSPAAIWRVDADGSDATLVVRGTSDGDWQWMNAEPDP